MRLLQALAIGAILAVIGVATALASHVPQVDPTVVPTGFLATHNNIAKKPPGASIARAFTDDGADIFVQHVQLGPGAATPWHTHPGPVFVTVVDGSLTYEDSLHGECRHLTYNEGTGFVDRGFGHVHRAVAGTGGVHFYATYVLPGGSANHVVLADPPANCVPAA